MRCTKAYLNPHDIFDTCAKEMLFFLSKVSSRKKWIVLMHIESRKIVWKVFFDGWRYQMLPLLAAVSLNTRIWEFMPLHT